ncbi:ATP-binding cassette domain-containing protein [Pendulispora rubella]|uniref:ATP-binding cassette domain-containing protein n=1 Tax=Pendulispora rubella TaxID=2741070 RepID=A0ABZ2LIR2_9BACT
MAGEESIQRLSKPCILSDTFAFNVLIGRRWPSREEDLREAATICRELGLGPLLDRMPGGLMQRVGETGWRLSHGERSRVYLARALLQGAELVILDESFASLDPETQKQALECAMKRAPTLMVIAHP